MFTLATFDASGVEAFILVLFVFIAYFFPFVVAVIRKRRNASAIFALTLFLGWSVIGWVWALAWACMDVDNTKLPLRHPRRRQS